MFPMQKLRHKMIEVHVQGCPTTETLVLGIETRQSELLTPWLPLSRNTWALPIPSTEKNQACRNGPRSLRIGWRGGKSWPPGGRETGKTQDMDAKEPVQLGVRKTAHSGREVGFCVTQGLGRLAAWGRGYHGRWGGRTSQVKGLRCQTVLLGAFRPKEHI